MKKFIITVCTVMMFVAAGYIIRYGFGIYIDFHPDVPATAFITTQGKTICMKQGDELVSFEIRGVDLGSGYPGEWSVDYGIDEKTYLKWFAQIQELGANTIRIYTIHHGDFYEAFYKYNKERERNNEEPLYLLQGVWVNDYVYNSHSSAYDDEFLLTLLKDCRTAVDVLHGNKPISLGKDNVASGSYWRDVSKWVLGYILGVEWESSLVIYTDQKYSERDSYEGRYLYTTEEASPFEAVMAQVGDKLIEYESTHYKQQRLVAFANWPTTDPFSYPLLVSYNRSKTTCFNVEHIKQKDSYVSGMFASYHIYPYFPDYLDILMEGKQYTEEEILEHYGILAKEVLEYRASLLNAPYIEDYLQESDFYDSQGRYNTYLAYLTVLARYHTIPVVISEYGVTTGRGMAREDVNTGRNQGHMTEEEQGKAVVECYQDIMASGCAGSCLFSWQDEWFKRTWNTMYAIDRNYSAYWSDYQTNEQSFGILTFDPGKKESVCYVDGDVSEWKREDMAAVNDGLELSMKYDEKFIYFMIHKKDFDYENDMIFIPVDTNPKVGSTYCENYDVVFERPCDFVMVVHGRDDSRIMVQERYEALMSIYHQEYYAINPYYEENTPLIDSPVFKPVKMALNAVNLLPALPGEIVLGDTYETGKLRYGNANPKDEDFDSLADFIFSGDYAEIRVPWELFNFSDPSRMMIHDDYYECYGIENLEIDKMYVGIAANEDKEYRILMQPFALKAWGEDVTFHERFKKSYYILKEYWNSLDNSKG